MAACGTSEPVQVVEQGVFSCSDPAQRLTCAAPDDAAKQFVCHATKGGYVKIEVALTSSHQPGQAHGPGGTPDQAPGASGDDVGAGIGLDCECSDRICTGTCTGAEAGAACDDGDKCTGEGSCAGDSCEPGAPSCTPGAPIDACNVESGACDGETGACGIQPLAAGTVCGVASTCDGNGECVPLHVVINEIESSGGIPGDWVELYNAGTAAADVSGWRFLDNDDTHTAYVIPSGTVIAPGGMVVLDEASFGFGLGAADSARLFETHGVLVDSYAWTSHATTTYGRCPNGTGAFRTTAAPTKGAPNDCSISIRINEIESSGGIPGDWVELINVGTATVDLSGLVFKDNDDTHAYVIPAGTTVAPGAYFVLEEAAFGFGLGAADSARLFDGAAIVDAYSWTSHATTTYGRCPDGVGAFGTMASVTKGAANDCASRIRINEIESSGGVPGDWVELINTGATAVDISGYVFKDNDDTHAYVIPAGTTVAPNAYYLLEEAAFGFGLGAADSARLFDASAVLVDSYTWTTHATITYGRCPNGTGAFATTTASTKGAANSCDGGGPPPATPWPGQNAVTTVDGTSVFGGNLSGLYYDAGTLWAVRNGPSTLYQLAFDGSIYAPAGQWNLHYPDGTGEPDAEDVTQAEGGSVFYVATERDNAVSATSRLSILRFDTTQPGSELSATHEWNLGADLPAVGANLGLEAITWIPDTTLVASGLFDEAAGHAYTPAQYPNHGSGVFFVGLEANGTIYAYVLDHVAGGFTRIATITADTTIHAVSFDRSTGYLWSTCGAACANQSTVFTIGATGRFGLRARFDKPSTMPNVSNEGIAIGSTAECVAGFKPFFWTDDAETGGHSIRRDSIPCGTFIP